MIEIGRLCIKTAGRDAGKKAIVINIVDKKYVLIDGETRRRKCNTAHLEPLDKVIDIKKEASHEEVKKAFEKIGLKAKDTKPKEKKKRPKKVRKKKQVLDMNETKKKIEKKAEVKKEGKKETKNNTKPKKKDV